MERLQRMISIAEILTPAQVDLKVEAATKDEAVLKVLDLLRGDPRVQNWERLRRAVQERNAPAVEQNECGILIAHGRTNSLSGLVMAAGRLLQPLTCPEIAVPIRLVFVAGIPRAVDTEYLRVIGAIVRALRDRHQLERLLGVKEAARFVTLLSSQETRL
ncbi:MAG TPA: PTS sugar transporter subunit IIA [Chthoniobacterales bacterium]